VNLDAGVEGMSFAWSDDFGHASIYAQEESPRVIATIRDRVFRDHDVLLAPTTQLVARKVDDWNRCWMVEHDRFAHGTFAGTYTSHVMLLNWLAMPAFSVPCGFVDGLPVGLQIIGKPGAEAKMLQIAQALQKLIGNPRPPAFE
jgi:aspartyl-tRNA(Asn)/glutamyl-tRNA(Gln) amidotransferase subunit A